MTELTSRERMSMAMTLRKADYVPCAFMSFNALRYRYHEDPYESVKAERAMGLDSFLFIPALSRADRPNHPDLRGLPVRFHPEVETREWRDGVPGREGILHKEYTTPGGRLQTSVRLSEDWPHGDHIPFVDDYQAPRALRHLLTGQAFELAALRYLLTPPHAEDVAGFQREAQKAHAFAKDQGVLLAGGWSVGVDMANWLCGFENLMVLAHEKPDFVAELLEIIHQWNLQRMKVVLSGGVDLLIHRAWYEGCDFVTPSFYREAILPRLKAEIILAHEEGALYGYICTSGLAPLLDFFPEAGIDVLIGVDPVQGTHTDLAAIKKRIGYRICLWGGVSGAITVELGTEGEVRAAVRQAIEALGPNGFILSPVDNIRIDDPKTWRNVDVLLDEWRRLSAGSGQAR